MNNRKYIERYYSNWEKEKSEEGPFWSIVKIDNFIILFESDSFNKTHFLNADQYYDLQKNCTVCEYRRDTAKEISWKVWYPNQATWELSGEKARDFIRKELKPRINVLKFNEKVRSIIDD